MSQRGKIPTICGHIHSPTIRDICGVAYYNSGDWVESNSALVEDFSGKIELITHYAADSAAAPQLLPRAA